MLEKRIQTKEKNQVKASMTYDPIQLEIYKHLFSAVAEEMGVVLRKSSYSPNIKERRDFSCAVFDSSARMIAQAAHIPVHLGSMPLSVLSAIEAFPDLKPGDIVALNDPFRGGTHLPDITLVSPVFLPGAYSKPYAFVASRAHHADVGGMTPGSMPIAKEIYQEGLILPPIRLVKNGHIDQELLSLILSNVRTPEERSGDLWAQVAANQRGTDRILDLVKQNGEIEVTQYMQELLDYTARMTRNLLEQLPDGEYAFSDYLDDDGLGHGPIPILVAIRIHGNSATVDFSGSAAQQKGSINAVYAISLSAVNYVFRCMLGLDVPNNAGCLEPIEVIAPPGSVVNANFPSPVAGGNVETSQRIVDVLLGALAQIPVTGTNQHVPAASQGTMNNITIGGYDNMRQRPFAYYETIGGGTGACFDAPGASAMHSHMTNTLNTPIEALEYSYPLQILRYAIRRGSGGSGKFRGGDGISREIKVLVDCQVTLLSERRVFAPYGLQGAKPGKPGKNVLIRSNQKKALPGKGTFELQAGDIISINTPGGGGYGHKKRKQGK